MANEFVARRGLIAQANSVITGSLTQGAAGNVAGTAAHAEGVSTTAAGTNSHAEGYLTVASQAYSHAEGQQTYTAGQSSHAEGYFTSASGNFSHAEGAYTKSSGSYSHTEGEGAIAVGQGSHAEGQNTQATGNYSHAEGTFTVASGEISHAEGYYTIASGSYSHAEGNNTRTLAAYQHAQGKYNVTSLIEGAFILGNGTNTTPSNLILAANNFVDISGSLHVRPNTTASVDLLSANKEQIEEVITTGQDTSFQGNYQSGGGAFSAILACAYVSNGNLVVGGTFTKFNSSDPRRLAQINTDGTPDNTFNTNLGSGFGGSDVTYVLPQTNGQILVGGQFSDLNGSTRNCLVRLESDGNEDTTFYTNLGTAFNGEVLALALNSNGDIFVGGNFTSFDGNSTARLVKLDSSGVEDTAFTTNLGAGFDLPIFAIEVQSDGKILVGGDFSIVDGAGYTRLVRLNTDGTVDTSFSSNYETSSGLNNRIRSIKVQSDGKILVGGAFTDLNGNTRYALVRLNSDGTEDSSFYTNLGSSFDDVVYSIQVQLDDKILVAGQYTAFNGNTRNYLVRLNLDGTEDTAFYTLLGGSTNGKLYSITTDSSGNIAAGGDFSTFDSNAATYLFKLSSTYNAPYKENISINRTPDNNLINIKGRNDSYNIIDVKNSSDNTVLSLNNSSSLVQGSPSNTATGLLSHAQGILTVSSGEYSHAEGFGSTATGNYSHAEGAYATALGLASHAEGNQTIAQRGYSHAEGDRTIASGSSSHAEGYLTVTTGSYSHAEGSNTIAIGDGSHAEGYQTIASASYSHVEGRGTTTYGGFSHAEGLGTTARGEFSHAEGYQTVAFADYSHAAGNQTIASGSYQSVVGQYNLPSTVSSAFIVGNGANDLSRSNLIFAAGTTVQITGSLRGDVSASYIVSNTASLDLAKGNFFTLNLVNGANTHISASNIRPGQTVNLRVSQSSAGTGTVSFNSVIEQPSGSAYTGSMIANAEDIVTFISFDSTKLYASAIRNLV